MIVRSFGKVSELSHHAPKVLSVCLGALLFLVPVIPFNFIPLEGYRFPITLLVRFFPFMIAFAIAVIFGLGFKHFQLRDGGFLSVIMLLLVLCGMASILGSFSSFRMGHSLTRSIYFLFTGEVLCLIVGLAISDLRTVVGLLWVSLLGAIVVSVYGLFEEVTGFHLLTEHVFSAQNDILKGFTGQAFSRSDRAVSTVGNANFLGAYLSLCSPFFLYFFLLKRSIWVRIIVGIGYASLIGLLYLTFSRGAWLAFLLGVSIFVGRDNKKWIYVITIVGLTILGWATLTQRVNDTYGELVVKYGDSHRTRSYAIATKIWESHPLWGTGAGTYRFFCRFYNSENDTPDNMYLLLLVENGILGLGLRLSTFILLINSLSKTQKYLYMGQRYALLKMEKRREYRMLLRAFWASSIGFLLNLLTVDGLQFPVTRIHFWILMGLSLATLRIVFDKGEKTGTSYTVT